MTDRTKIKARRRRTVRRLSYFLVPLIFSVIIVAITVCAIFSVDKLGKSFIVNSAAIQSVSPDNAASCTAYNSFFQGCIL